MKINKIIVSLQLLLLHVINNLKLTWYKAWNGLVNDLKFIQF